MEEQIFEDCILDVKTLLIITFAIVLCATKKYKTLPMQLWHIALVLRNSYFILTKL